MKKRPECKTKNQPQGVRLGARIDSGEPLWLSYKARKRHVYILGVSGSGKSYLMSDMACQDIENNIHGYAAIDFIETFVPYVRQYVASLRRFADLKARTQYRIINKRIKKHYQKRLDKVEILTFEDHQSDQSIPQYHFNPIERVNNMSTEDCTSDVMKCFDLIENTGSGDSSGLNQQKLRQLNFRTGISLACELGATILDVPAMFDMNESQLQDFITRLDNQARAEGRVLRLEFVRDYYQKFIARATGKELRDILFSTYTGIGQFENDPIVRNFLSARHSNLDLYKIVNEGGFLLIDLSHCHDYQSKRILGGLILNRIHTICERRTPEQRKNLFTVYADEFHHLLSDYYMTAISYIRNYGYCMILSHQDQSQLKNLLGDKMLRSIQGNAGTHLYFQLSTEDSFDAAYRTYFPLGLTLKQELIEESETIQFSRAWSRSKGISDATGRALANSESTTHTLSNGLQFSYTENKGVSKARFESHGLTITEGENWTRAESDTEGVSITVSENETTVQGTGTGFSTTEARGESESRTSGRSTGRSQNEGLSDMLVFDSDGRGMRFMQSSGASESVSDNHSVGTHLSNAISKVIAASRSVANGKGKATSNSHSHSLTNSIGGSHSESQSQSVSEGLSVIQGVSKSVGKSLTEGVSEGKTRTETRSRTHTESETFSELFGISYGRTRKKTRQFYSIDEDARAQSYKLATQKARHATMLDKVTGAVAEFRTDDMPTEFDLMLGKTDYKALLEKECAPPAVTLEEKPALVELSEKVLAELKKKKKTPEGF